MRIAIVNVRQPETTEAGALTGFPFLEEQYFEEDSAEQLTIYLADEDDLTATQE